MASGRPAQKHSKLAALIAAFLRAGKPVAIVPAMGDLVNGITDGRLITGNGASPSPCPGRPLSVTSILHR